MSKKSNLFPKKIFNVNFHFFFFYIFPCNETLANVSLKQMLGFPLETSKILHASYYEEGKQNRDQFTHRLTNEFSGCFFFSFVIFVVVASNPVLWGNKLF